MKDVCLIIPPSAFLLDERVFPSLGLLRVAAVLEQENVPVHVMDLSGVSNFLDVVKSYFSLNWPFAVGITATTPQFPFVKQIAEAIRSVHPEVRLILGGPHGTLCYAGQKMARKRGLKGERTAVAIQAIEALFDVVCLGDGENSILAALEDNVPQVIDADDRHSPNFLTNDSYEALPLPARHRLDMGTYHYSIEGKEATSLIAQLGCPFPADSAADATAPASELSAPVQLMR